MQDGAGYTSRGERAEDLQAERAGSVQNKSPAHAGRRKNLRDLAHGPVRTVISIERREAGNSAYVTAATPRPMKALLHGPVAGTLRPQQAASLV
jgi:hypothetical protein